MSGGSLSNVSVGTFIQWLLYCELSNKVFREDSTDALPDFVFSSHLPEPQAASYWRLLSICQLGVQQLCCPPQAPQQRLSSGSHSRSRLLPAGRRVLTEPRMNPEYTTHRSHNQRWTTRLNSAPFFQDGSRPAHVVDTLTSAKSRGESAGCDVRKCNSFLSEVNIYYVYLYLKMWFYCKVWVGLVNITDFSCFNVNKITSL